MHNSRHQEPTLWVFTWFANQGHDTDLESKNNNASLTLYKLNGSVSSKNHFMKSTIPPTKAVVLPIPDSEWPTFQNIFVDLDL